jgi:D-beta-D-heptose 7-phosphate kinase/D-beta-D-heptose 1-phosphate adenosyltransferase
VKTVFINGVFDLFHPGHVAVLRFAKAQGDMLTVGVNSDSSARELGKDPLMTAAERAIMVLTIADAVFTFDEKLPYESIVNVRPDVLVVGCDHSMNDRACDFVRDYGGKVVQFPDRVLSTTDLLERIKR